MRNPNRVMDRSRSRVATTSSALGCGHLSAIFSSPFRSSTISLHHSAIAAIIFYLLSDTTTVDTVSLACLLSFLEHLYLHYLESRFQGAIVQTSISLDGRQEEERQEEERQEVQATCWMPKP
ncbi:hypothetical protein L1887_38758 [Cichorium endivia]|nr:hypothetical protein L1887_38758 [Cichorium endivia]